jgi:hypothetical protein
MLRGLKFFGTKFSPAKCLLSITLLIRSVKRKELNRIIHKGCRRETLNEIIKAEL